MRNVTKATVAAALVAAASIGMGMETHTATCYSSGANTAEPVGDRDGHAIQAAAITCLESGGVFDGMVSTQNLIWEHDASGSKLLSGDGMGRKPGALVAFRYLEGGREPVMQDGKRVGWLVKGKGVFTLATGGMAAFSGKTFTWVLKRAAPGRTDVETTIED